MAQIFIRPVPLQDSDQAATISRQAMRTVPGFDEALHSIAEDRAFWRDEIFARCDVLGAYENGLLLGQIALAPGWIHQLHVDPARHGEGLGSALLEAARQRLDDIQLWTFQANAGARRFYERHGFIAMEFTDGAGNEEKLPDVRYRWLR